MIDKWLKDYLPKRDRCWNVGTITEVKNHTVNMDDMQGSFFVLFLGKRVVFGALLGLEPLLFLGVLTATIVILIEKLWKKRILSKEQKLIQPFMT